MKLLLSTILILLALLERVYFDFGPNVELVTMAMLLAAIYLGGRYSAFVVLTTLIASDILIGNTSIAIFTWSGFLLPSLLIPLFFKKKGSISNIYKGLGAGIGANLFFFLWTNMGVWLMSGMYPSSMSGLAMSYVNGLPFLKLQLFSTLLFVPFGIIIFEISKSLLFGHSHNLRSEKA